MARTTPRVQGERLVQQECPDACIAVGSLAWFGWLEGATTFAFSGDTGSFTARKERGGRGGWYWKAYRTSGGVLRRAYLGKSSDLTLDRLRAAAAELACSESPAVAVQQPAPPSELLAAKLMPPALRHDLVARTRLWDLLTNGLRGKLTLLAAPAGYGKTTLLGAWGCRMQKAKGQRPNALADTSPSHPPIPSPQSPVPNPQLAWLSLDAGDNDPGLFWRYVIAALAGVYPALAGVQVEGGDLTALLNGLSGQTGGAALVLDDYGAIHEQAIHRGLALLIERMPPQLRLVVATRSDPPLPLARLRAQGELTELRAADLRFGHDEGAAFFAAQGLELSADATAALVGRAEGWAAGLRLAALALRDRSLEGRSALDGNRFVADYLGSEVLDQLPPRLYAFVLRTSIIEQLNPALCAALLEEAESPTPQSLVPSPHLLDELTRCNSFLFAFDHEGRSYRYHQLLAEVARRRLVETTSEDERAALHTKARVWYEGQGLSANAIGHALAASAWEDAGRLIGAHGLALATSGLAPEVRRSLEALPAQLLDARPHLGLLYALTLLFTGELDAAEARLDRAEGAIEEDALNLLAQIALARANVARCRGDLARCVALSEQVLVLAGETTPTAQAGAMLNLARSFLLSGDVAQGAEQLAEESVALMRGCGNRSGLLASIVNLARLQSLQGRLHAALATYNSVADEPLLSGWRGLVGAGAHHVGLGELLRERGQNDEAESELRRGLDLLGRELVVDADTIVAAHWGCARLLGGRGDGAGAGALLDALQTLVRQRKLDPSLTLRVGALRAQLALARGDLTAATCWADGCGHLLDDDLSFWQEEVYLTLARVRSAELRAARQGGDHDSTNGAAVLELLDRLLVAAEAGERGASVITILVVRALALEALGNLPGALVALARALVRAAPAGYVACFVEGGEPMETLLREAAVRGIAPEYVATLLDAFPAGMRRERDNDAQRDSGAAEVAPQPHHLITPALLEPLTPREREVLRLVAEGASNRQIAQRLTLSLGTIKRYVNGIFGKLDVQSRTQAISKARMLRLV